MKRPRVWDTFMFHDELDILLCRLTEIHDAVDGFIVIESEVTHQDQRKPSYLKDNWSLFADFHDKLVPVWATGLPTIAENPDPWAREHAQREWARVGLHQVGAVPDDVVLHGDVDEIPTKLVARNVRPQGFVAFQQRLYCFAIDWQHPDPWYGTVAGRVGKINSFGAMRDARNIAPKIENGGWHLSWLGGSQANLKKLHSFCHPEVADRINVGLHAGNKFLQHGIHVDGAVMLPVDVDRTWPKWIVEGKAPASWYRPR